MQSKIDIVTYSPSHNPYIREWLDFRGLNNTSTSDLPKIGFIAIKDIPIAAAFLRTCEGSMGILDGLVTNPKASSLDRHEAIDSIVSTILKEAKYMGITKIIAYSIDQGVLDRSIKHGFCVQKHTLISWGG